MDTYKIISLICSVIIALCALYGRQKVTRTTRYILLKLNRSKKFKQFYLSIIGVFFITGLLLSFLIGLMSFTESFSVYKSFFWFAFMFSSVAYFSYTSYKLAQ